MDQNNKHIDWDNLLKDLEKDSSEGKLLTQQEQELLIELRAIKAEASDLLKDYKYYDTKEQWNKLKNHIEKTAAEKKVFKLWPRIAAAASVLFILSVASYFLLLKTDTFEQTVQLKSKDILPGGNKAILTLADGKKLVLTDAVNGNLAQQGNAAVFKNKDGEVSYHAKGHQSTTATVFNTVSTPRGGMYKLILEDGTLAILNATSSITFPTSFSGNERKVTITGEVYFEVSHNAEKPFKVISEGQTVQVLGTHFNINAYKDESAVRTTLLEGSVKVTNTKQQSIYMEPGQQVQNNQGLTLITKIDTEEAIAWKNGFFHFNNADVSTVMRALSRWYDVDIVYEGTPTSRRFTGDIHRNMNASKALEILSYLKIHFRIEGKKIVVIQ